MVLRISWPGSMRAHISENTRPLRFKAIVSQYVACKWNSTLAELKTK